MKSKMNVIAKKKENWFSRQNTNNWKTLFFWSNNDHHLSLENFPTCHLLGQLRRRPLGPPASFPDPPPQSCRRTGNAGTICGDRELNNSRAGEQNRAGAAPRTDRPGRWPSSRSTRSHPSACGGRSDRRGWGFALAPSPNRFGLRDVGVGIGPSLLVGLGIANVVVVVEVAAVILELEPEKDQLKKLILSCSFEKL